MNTQVVSLLTCCLIFLSSTLFAQAGDPGLAPEKVRVFLDCRTNCDLSYMQQELPFVDYVRDQTVADVHVLVNRFGTGAGGARYTFAFIGKGYFSQMETEMTHVVAPAETWEEIRQGLRKKLTLGLVPFLSETELVDKMDVLVDYTENKGKAAEEIMEDPWNSWVFEVYTNGNANLQSTQRTINWRAGGSVRRVTEHIKFSQTTYFNLNNKFIEKEEDDDIRTSRKNYGVYGTLVKSIDNHWSVGLFDNFSSSTFSNYDFNMSLGPALEYSFFPYNEVMQRELTVAYYNRVHYRDYIEETIFDKMEETLWGQAVRVALRLRKPWGSVFSSIEGRHFMHDLSKNSVELNNRISLRVVKGLGVNLTTNFELVNDQLSLPKGNTSVEDLLLQQTQQATDYELYLAFGLNYTFGSMFNNVVNTRL